MYLMKNTLDSLPLVGTYSEKWMQFKDIIMQPTTTVLGLKTQNHKNWFDKSHKIISAVLWAKSKSYTDWQNDPSSVLRKDKFNIFNLKYRHNCIMQDKWLQGMLSRWSIMQSCMLPKTSSVP